ncbi:fluoride efflux transporter CrcB [Tepidibacillus fermentans]|nr:fluoride efflux transporter CrcB [Tepidibacillus fermentans]
MNYFAVGLAGVIGALLRYYLGLSFHHWWISPLPLGTLMINYIGAFVLAWFNEKVAHTYSVPDWLRLGFGTGLVGSFTTFSTLSVETVTLIRLQLWGIAFSYVLLSLFGGLFFAYAGYRMGNLGLKQGEKEVETA